MKEIEAKTKRQEEGIERWRSSKLLGLSHANGWGTFQWATGFGKTYAANKIISRLLNRDKEAVVVVIVHSLNNSEQWRKEIEKLSDGLLKGLKDRIHIFTINTLIDSGKEIECTLKVIDELKQYESSERSKALERVRSKFAIALEASPYNKDGKPIELLKKYPVVDIITESYGIQHNLLADYSEFNLGVELTEEERAKYNTCTRIIDELKVHFGEKDWLIKATGCIQGDKAKGLSADSITFAWAEQNGWYQDMDLRNPKLREIDDFWRPSRIVGRAIRIMNAVRLRKDIVIEAENKMAFIVDILDKVYPTKSIVFSLSTNFATDVQEKVNEHFTKKTGVGKEHCVLYHSNLKTITEKKGDKILKIGKKRLAKRAIEAIEEGKSTVLSTCNSLGAGLDIPDLKVAIIASGNSDYHKALQRKGRVKRKDTISKEAKNAMIVNLYCKDTVELNWLINSQKNLPRVKWIGSLEQIFNTETDAVKK